MRQAHGQMASRDGLQLFYRLWEPDAEARGSIVLVHGMAEHTGRYEHVARWFAERGFVVWAMDHRGHGRSEGLRLYVDRFEQYLTDLHDFVIHAAAEAPTEGGRPVMVGHSMGGLIAYHYAAAHPDQISGLILSSPWFRTRAKTGPIQRLLAPALSALLPRLQLPTPVVPEVCTQSPEMRARDRQDPLICRKATPRWFVECSRAAEACLTTVTFPAGLPVLFLAAGADLLVDAEAIRAVYSQVDHDRKAFKFYPDKYHEIFNDPGWEAVLADVLAFMDAQELVPKPEPEPETEPGLEPCPGLEPGPKPETEPGLEPDSKPETEPESE